MQPLSREVRSEINEYEREEQRLAKQKKLMVMFKTWLTFLNFQHMLCHPSHTAHTLSHMGVISCLPTPISPTPVSPTFDQKWRFAYS